MDSVNDEMDPGRSGKLAAAKKKLKQFQQRHKVPSSHGDKENGRPLSAAFPGNSSESLAESSKSADKFFARNSCDSPDRKRYSISSLPTGAGSTSSQFHHDEHRSPFHRIKRPSESSECSSTAVIQNQGENLHFSENNPFHIPFSQQILDEEACTSDIKEFSIQKGASVVDTNEENDQKMPLSTNIYQNLDENRLISSVNTSNYISSDVNVIKHNVHDEGNRELDMNNRNFNEKFENISNATVDQQVKNEFLSDLNSNSFENASEKRLIVANNDIDPVWNHLETENISLKQQNEQLQMYCQQITNQLNELNGHYTQLHSAYANLSEEHNGHLRTQHMVKAMNQQNQNQNDLQNQIQQHIQTMSVLVEEKTDLQSQLRQAMDIANKKNLENEELQGRLKASRERLTSLEKETETNNAVRTAVETTLQRQTAELERVRRESAQYQAKLTELQQDKSELSSRLKIRNREVDDFLTKVKEAEKQNQMKDIYIQQLTGGHQTTMVNEIERMRQENQRLQTDFNECRLSAERWKYEAEQSNDRYESYGRQLNLKIVQLSGELEKLSNEKLEAETKLQRLETEFQSLKIADDSSTMKNSSSIDEKEFLKIRADNASLKEEYSTLMGEKSQLQSSLLEKDKILANLQANLNDKEDKIRRFEEFVTSNDMKNQNVQGLLEQLHNEKATSSRAVAQNLSLKNQLVEIEDKFVAVTQDEMEMLTKLQSAEHSVQLLGVQLVEKTEEMQKMNEQHDEKYKSLQTQMNSIMKQEYDRKQFEDRLHHYEATQKATQDDLISCRSEISHLTVENASLRQRLNENEENFQRMKEANDLSSSNADPDSSFGEDATLRLELMQLRQRTQHLSTENAELHRIMEQNAADENQNTIHVELRQAVERMTSLSRDNDDLRRNVVRLRDQLIAANEERRNLKDTMEEMRNVATNSNGFNCDEKGENKNDDHSSICSEHTEQRREAINSEAFDNMKKAMDQLQSRFTRALTENADLSDQNEQLEHLIMQLQNETETIGEYVTLYQHQRKIIRDRLREKEDYVARLSREKEEIQSKLTELQHLVMHLLKEKGALRSYSQLPPTHSRPPRSPPSKLPERPRNLSETLIDETTLGSEQAVLVSEHDVLGSQLAVSSDHSEDVGENLGEPEIAIEAKPNRSPRVRTPSPMAFVVDSNQELDENSPTAERILKLLTEMRRPDLINTLPPSDRSLHCKYCTGKLIML